MLDCKCPARRALLGVLPDWRLHRPSGAARRAALQGGGLGAGGRASARAPAPGRAPHLGQQAAGREQRRGAGLDVRRVALQEAVLQHHVRAAAAAAALPQAARGACRACAAARSAPGRALSARPRAQRPAARAAPPAQLGPGHPVPQGGQTSKQDGRGTATRILTDRARPAAGRRVARGQAGAAAPAASPTPTAAAAPSPSWSIPSVARTAARRRAVCSAPASRNAATRSEGAQSIAPNSCARGAPPARQRRRRRPPRQRHAPLRVRPAP